MFSVKSRSWVLPFFVVASLTLAFPCMADDGAGQPIKQKSAPPPNPPAKDLPGFRVSADLSNGFLLAGGTGYLRQFGPTFVTANRDPAAILSNNPDPCDHNGDPILPQSGAKVDTYPLFALPGEMGLTYVLYYNSLNLKTAWRSNLDFSLDLDCLDNTDSPSGACLHTTVMRADGSSIRFSGGPDASVYSEVRGDNLATLTKDPATGNYIFHDEDATTEVFNADGSLLSVRNASGVGWTFSHPTVYDTTVTHTSGAHFSVSYTPPQQTYQPDGHVLWLQTATVTDPAGNVYTIQFQNWQVSSITQPGTPATVIGFKYDPVVHQLTEVDYNGIPYSYTTYDTNTASPYYRRATATYLADGSEKYTDKYSSDALGSLSVTVTNPFGHQSIQYYGGTDGSGGLKNGQLSLISDDAVQTCGATTHGRSYDENGNLSEEIDNNDNVHTYRYAANGQLQTETEAYGTPVARTANYVWDPNPQLNRILSTTINGWEKTSYTYTPQNRLATVSITNLSPTGTANQTLTTQYNYVLYPNGMVKTMTVSKPSPGGSDAATYSYDVLGNLASLTNSAGQTYYGGYNSLGEVGEITGPNGDKVDYTYDGRGRIRTVTTYPNGSAATWTYAYDGFGLVYTLTGPDGQVTTWARDPSTMRVATITRNDKDGASTESYRYDANGDVIEHKVVRGSTVGLIETYEYDDLGRLYKAIGQHGQIATYGYDGNGNVLSVTNAMGHTIGFEYDALNRVTKATESGGASDSMPSSAPTLNVPANSSSGGYTVSWGSLAGATNYQLQEQVNGGGWSDVQRSAALSWSASGKASATYGYHVRACNVTGCGPWSATRSISVVIPTAPSGTPVLSAPSSSTTGSYTVTWTAVTGASTYNLEEQVNGGSPHTFSNGAGLSWSASGKASGAYTYRSQGCNAVGCGTWSSARTVQVTIPPPPPAPSLTSPANNGTGSYTVTWTGVSGATSYTLQQQFNGGTWKNVFTGVATSWGASGEVSGTYGYRVEACNSGGCTWSATHNTVVTIPVPIAINGQTYSVSYGVPQGVTASVSIGFDITGGNHWEVFTTKPGAANVHVVATSGTVPSGSATVKYTWIDGGVPSGYDAAGSITNPAASPVAVSSNPFTQYTTATYGYRADDRTHVYQFRVDFYNASGILISTSTCTLKAEIMGTL